VTASAESSSRPADRPRALVALGAVLAITAFLIAWALLHEGFYEDDQIVDTPVYAKYGDWMSDGRMPYRDFRPEYPPLALPVFLVPSLVAGQDARLGAYSRAFEWLLALCGAGVLVLVAVTLHTVGAGPARLAAALAFPALAPLALGSVVLSRFDLWPALLVAGALAALVGGRDRLGSGVLALAVAAKLYPAVLVPVAVAWIWRRRGRGEMVVCGAVFVAVLAVCFAPFLLIAPTGVAASLGRQLSRPLQIESLGSAILLALDADVEMASGHGSQNVAGTPGVVAGIVTTVLQAATLIWLWVRFARGGIERERLIRYSAAAVVAFAALGKVLSPQFLIWLVPLVPLVRGRRGVAASALLALALLLTQLWFPYRYWDFARTFDETVAWLVLARDLVLVSVLVVLVARDEGGDTADRGGDERREAARAGVLRSEPDEGVVLR
jgi:Glycosyltransferase family 87